MNDLGCISNADVLQQLVSLEGKRVLDAGCGDLTFTRLLTECGARVIAIDPDAVQAEKNRNADPTPGIKFVESGAEVMPADDKTIDGVFFSYSLHHIPRASYPAVFAEVLRVLKPDGFLYVLEPTDCPLNQVMKLFHDEDAERAAAWQAVESLRTEFKSATTVSYYGYRQFESWDDFADTFSNRSFNELYTETDVRRPEVKSAFESHAGPDFRFQSPKRVMLLQEPIG